MDGTIDALFVCEGNAARSQMAEGFHRFMYDDKTVQSAGICATQGEKIPKNVIVLMEKEKGIKEKGIQLYNLKADVLTFDMVNNAKRVVVMCPQEKLIDYLSQRLGFSGQGLSKLEKERVEYWPVADPYKRGNRALRAAKNRIKYCVRRMYEEGFDAAAELQSNKNMVRFFICDYVIPFFK
ncbi:low molecular weight phosphatase family protein [Candidatus Woesearchaeota archaeon]|nr:low molecular weight phosphatase family protein [Candidatus Woesearchaeota archaeon]